MQHPLRRSNGGRFVDTELGLFIAGRTDIVRVTTDNLIGEARTWGIHTGTAGTAIAELAAAVTASLDSAVADVGIDVPAAII